jgi:hypothetical protein
MALYVAVTSFAVAFYQQSEDEGRAWILSRSFSLFELVFHMLRYEGHPGLYYCILWLLSHAGLPYPSVNWIFAVCGWVAIWLLLRSSPFPFYVRAVLPFGFALGYQYAVEARSYALFPLLGFWTVILYRRSPARPIAMAVALGLLANVSLHGTLVATGFAVAYWVRLRSLRSPLERPARTDARVGVCIFSASLLLVLVCVWPVKYMNLSLPMLGRRVVHRLFGPVSYQPSPSQAGGVSLRLASFAQTPGTPPATPRHRLLVRMNQLLFVLVYPVANWAALALLFEGLIVVYLVQQRKLVLLLPLVLLTWFLVLVYGQAWHMGLIWVTLLMILWAAWESEAQSPANPLRNTLAVVLALIGALQLPWTAAALRYETGHATFPARAAARYLKTLPASTRIDGNELAFTVMPYFPRYIFMDHGPGRFAGHGNWPENVSIPEFVAERADVILLRTADVTADDRRVLGSAGYSERHTFCGGFYFPKRKIQPTCLSEFEKQ